MKSVLIGSPVRQKAAILKEFLWSLARLTTEDLQVEFAFVDDHDTESELLRQFPGRVTIIRGDGPDVYDCDEETHHWREGLIWKVAAHKDTILQLARERNADFVFLVDSDLVLHPQTLRHLVSLEKDIVSEVFWTRWHRDLIPLPQVWVAGQYRLHDLAPGENLTEEEVMTRIERFFTMLRTPGTYRVGGLGACTLISRKALSLGVSFAPVYNLDYGGEDRHFCIRAVSSGLALYADTHYPPCHIYRESDLAALAAYKEANFPPERTGTPSGVPQPRITLGMLVRNEAGRYLEKVIRNAARYIDNAVILDDGSDDDTVQTCRRVLADVPLTLAGNRTPAFANEVVLRKQLWDMVTSTGPEWILILDADEVFEDGAAPELRALALNRHVDVFSFRLYDMWDDTRYRDDGYWQAHRSYRPFMVRYLPGFDYRWKETPLHCGRFPANIAGLKTVRSSLRVQHLGWARPEDRLAKYGRYQKLDPEAAYGIAGQYLSILDPKPNLLAWVPAADFHGDDLLASRFFRRPDPQTGRLVFPLPAAWWSRGYEYEWAGKFCDPGDVALDAGCGLSHPFKFHLADHCREVHACDRDERILSPDEILAAVAQDFGPAQDLPARYFECISYARGSLTALPYEDNKFDTIYCLSVLEHMPPADITPALKEFARTLRKDGMLVLTFDYPLLNLRHLQTVVPFLGLSFAGGVSLALPDDALTCQGLYCFRAVLRKP
ncbi:MAG: methyltransferase domain-containing protein [Peptococcaceae bacterium]|jgi:cellulose synthase/poly-beta-1,6-N-acetylglucosamine synthase-like glycosyltransferase/SAM-dependent methyltransferase|nr:methyltransferase domain-containing protein [Peptococcaceae bacterium]